SRRESLLHVVVHGHTKRCVDTAPSRGATGGIARTGGVHCYVGFASNAGSGCGAAARAGPSLLRHADGASTPDLRAVRHPRNGSGGNRAAARHAAGDGARALVQSEKDDSRTHARASRATAQGVHLMTCAEARDAMLIADADELRGEMTGDLARHLTECARCRAL